MSIFSVMEAATRLPLVAPFILSAALIALAISSRMVADRFYICKAERTERHQRRFVVRAVINAVLALGLLAIWIDELQSVLFSLTAVMVALVVATKELLQCVGGAALRVGGHLFRIGDRIEVRGMHGEVLDHSLFSTTLQELPPAGSGHRGTGRTFMLPNSVFLTDPVRIEAQPRRFAPHRFQIVMDEKTPARAAYDALVKAAGEVGRADAERAERFHRMVASRTGCDECGPEPSIHISTNGFGKLVFDVGIYCLVENAERFERTIKLNFLDEMQKGADQKDQASDLRETALALQEKLAEQLRHAEAGEPEPIRRRLAS